MSVPVLPESAPFNAEQRAWLNGFFAGLLGGADLPPPSVPAPLASGAEPEPAGAAAAGSAEDFPWHDPSLPLDERIRLAEGRPLASRLMAAMAQLDCGACGYLCRTYSEAIARGEETSLTRCAPGGRETARTLKEILAGGNEPAARPAALQAAAPATSATAGAPAAAPSAPGARNPFPARLVRTEKLTRDGSSKETVFVAFDLEGSGIRYEPGDALGVLPENCPGEVERLIELLGARGDEAVPASSGGELPLWEALLRERDIREAGEPVLELLAEYASPPARSRLRGLAAGKDERLAAATVVELLEELAVSPPPTELTAALESLRPRLYSISSSASAHPDEVHLTVAVVRFESDGRPRKGVASTFLAERLGRGQRARIFLRPTPSFRLPASDSTPMVMIGPGTGIAPFRAFLEERRARGARGGSWLFFGERNRRTDFLYEDELAGYLRDGVLERLETAFSRDQGEKVYVQHHILEHGAELWRWLERGAHFYVCGDARHMAAGVDAALRRVVEEHGGRSRLEAAEYLRALAASGRYQKDVY
jgi:sulfite reductase (NADPH) flavoprotein alpha-component